MSVLDAICGEFRWYRKLRGGKWERTSACCACPVPMWHRVDLYRPGHWPTVIHREYWP